jgi:hypothetical protein
MVDRGRSFLNTAGMRDFSVTVRLETYDRAFRNGAVLLSCASTLLTPPPKVTKLGGEDASWFGGGTMIAEAGGRKAPCSVYEISKLTPAYTGGAGGGYDLETLCAPVTNGTTERLVFLLVGPGIMPLVAPYGGLLADGGEPFEIADADQIGQLTNKLIVRRAPVIHSAV